MLSPLSKLVNGRALSQSGSVRCYGVVLHAFFFLGPALSEQPAVNNGSFTWPALPITEPYRNARTLLHWNEDTMRGLCIEEGPEMHTLASAGEGPTQLKRLGWQGHWTRCSQSISTVRRGSSCVAQGVKQPCTTSD